MVPLSHFTVIMDSLFLTFGMTRLWMGRIMSPCSVCYLLVRLYLFGQHQALSSKHTLHFNAAVWFRPQLWKSGMWPIWVARLVLDAPAFPGFSDAHLSTDWFECLVIKSIRTRPYFQLPCVFRGIRVSRIQVVLYLLFGLLICWDIEINTNHWEK